MGQRTQTRRRRLTLWVVASVVLAALPVLARPVPPAGRAPLPDDVVLFDSNRTGNYELFRMRTDGSEVVQLTSDPAYDTWWPKISPDRRRILFTRTPKGVHDQDYLQITTWTMNVDGSEVREILPRGAHGWDGQGHPEWSPDGERIVTMCGPEGNVQICIVDADGSDPFQVTTQERSTAVDLSPEQSNGNRGGTNIDPSWHPDGTSLLFVGCPINVCTDSQLELYRIGADGSGETRLTFDAVRDHDPYYSPDGTTVAWLRATANPVRWGIYAMAPDGSDQRAVIDDGKINSKPGWAVDGSWIYFHRLDALRPPFSIWRIRPDGTGLTELNPRPAIGPSAYDDEYPVNSSF